MDIINLLGFISIDAEYWNFHRIMAMMVIIAAIAAIITAHFAHRACSKANELALLAIERVSASRESRKEADLRYRSYLASVLTTSTSEYAGKEKALEPKRESPISEIT